MSEIISPNMLKTFELCPKKYFFRYKKSLSMPVNNEIFKTGKNIHALASYYLKKENIDNLEPALNPKEKEIWNYLKNTKYFSYETVHTEYNLAVKIGKHFFGGRLDALVKDGEKYYILDYKTGSAPKNSKYDFQTMIYMLAVRAFFKTDNISFVYIDLKNRAEIVIDLTKDLALEYEKKLSEITKEINKGIYPAKHTNCKTCEYRIICYDKAD